MKRAFFLIFLVLMVPLLLGACANFVRLDTNIPLSVPVISVINNTPYIIDIYRDGVLVRRSGLPARLRPGDPPWPIAIWGSYGGSIQTSIAVIAKTEEGKFIGSAARSFYVSGSYRETWLVSKWDIRSVSGNW